MYELSAELQLSIEEAAATVRLESAELTRFPRMLDGMLKLIYDPDEDIRYNAVQMLALMPESSGGSTIPKALITKFSSETSDRIQFLLLPRLLHYVRAGDFSAFQAIQSGSLTATSRAVVKSCVSALRYVSDDFILDAIGTLETARAKRPHDAQAISAIVTSLRLRQYTFAASIAALRDWVQELTEQRKRANEPLSADGQGLHAWNEVDFQDLDEWDQVDYAGFRPARFESLSFRPSTQILEGIATGLRCYLDADNYVTTYAASCEPGQALWITWGTSEDGAMICALQVLNSLYDEGYVRTRCKEGRSVQRVELFTEVIALDENGKMAELMCLSYALAIDSDPERLDEVNMAWKLWLQGQPEVKACLLTLFPHLAN